MDIYFWESVYFNLICIFEKVYILFGGNEFRWWILEMNGSLLFGYLVYLIFVCIINVFWFYGDFLFLYVLVSFFFFCCCDLFFFFCGVFCLWVLWICGWFVVCGEVSYWLSEVRERMGVSLCVSYGCNGCSGFYGNYDVVEVYCIVFFYCCG